MGYREKLGSEIGNQLVYEEEKMVLSGEKKKKKRKKQDFQFRSCFPSSLFSLTSGNLTA